MSIPFRATGEEIDPLSNTPARLGLPVGAAGRSAAVSVGDCRPVFRGRHLDEIVREGARRMLAAALEEEVAAYVAAHAGQRDEADRRLVVRNGHARPRQVATVAGSVEVAAPRVNDKRTDDVTGERARFLSAILPPWCRRSPKVTEVLPLLYLLYLLYLHGLSS